MQKKIYKIEGMHCASCAAVIECDLEDEGIKATCSYATQTLEVEFDEHVAGVEKIAQIVAKSGYRLNSKQDD